MNKHLRRPWVNQNDEKLIYVNWVLTLQANNQASDDQNQISFKFIDWVDFSD